MSDEFILAAGADGEVKINLSEMCRSVKVNKSLLGFQLKYNQFDLKEARRMSYVEVLGNKFTWFMFYCSKLSFFVQSRI